MIIKDPLLEPSSTRHTFNFRMGCVRVNVTSSWQRAVREGVPGDGVGVAAEEKLS
jgi:hypothetical protein